MRADLHIHTTASDGRFSPEEIVSLAAEASLNVVAITDHDTVEGLPAAMSSARSFPAMIVIPGIEVSTASAYGEVHVLGYFLEYNNGKLGNVLKQSQVSRRERAEKMVARLRGLGMEIDLQRVLELARGDSVGRPHVAQALLERGYVSSLKEAFVKYIGRSGPAYVKRAKLSPVEAVRLILDARGLPVLAHPAAIANFDEFLTELKSAGLAGMEVFYGFYPPEEIDRLYSISESYGLIATGGSDYHGWEGFALADATRPSLPQRSIKQLFDLAGKSDDLGRLQELVVKRYHS